MESRKFRLWESAALIALCIALCAGSFFSREVQYLEKNVIRLHVVAASDAEEEQLIKLRVRDAVLAVLQPMLAESRGSGEACERILAGQGELLRAAEGAAEGRPVALSLARESFGVTESGGMALPAGTYSTLRLTLGEGEGHNWWGVVFPELTPAPAVDAVKLSGGVSLFPGGDGYIVRFRSLELLDSLIEKLRA